MAETAPQPDSRRSEIHAVKRSGQAGASIGLQVADAELVERMLGGDRWAKEAFYRKHVERAYRVARRLVRAESDAEDVVQEAFAQAFSDLPKLREPEALKAWFLRIVVNRAHRKFRKRKVLQFIGWEASEEHAQPFLVHEEVSSEVRTELSLIGQALDKVGTAKKTAWVLRRVEGCSLAEVASACDVSLATVKRHVAVVDEVVAAFVAAKTKGGGR